MDEISTPITERLLSKALKKEGFPKPSAVSLEFIRNFARNFKVERNIAGEMREFVLN